MSRPTVYFLIGPTAVGKTEAAIAMYEAVTMIVHRCRLTPSDPPRQACRLEPHERANLQRFLEAGVVTRTELNDLDRSLPIMGSLQEPAGNVGHSLVRSKQLLANFRRLNTIVDRADLPEFRFEDSSNEAP